MLTVKCPKCATALKLRQAPPAGKVKCPKCGGIVPVAAGAPAPAPAQQAVAKTPRPTSGTVDPDDENFDFGRIQFPSASGVTAVSQFPSSGRVSVYTGPIPGDPLANTESDEQEETPAQAKVPKKKKKDPKKLMLILGGTAALLLIGVIGAVMFSGGGEESGGGTVDLLAQAQASAPAGYRAYGAEGAVIVLPAGEEADDTSNEVESLRVRSSATGSTYFFGVGLGATAELNTKQMRNKAERAVGGEFLGGQDTERNGYKGIKGMLDGSHKFPRMKIEAYYVDKRFCILGVVPLSMGADPGSQIDRGAEASEEKIFFDTFKIGPKPAGGWW